jgi:hypothetical protein
MDHGAAMSRLDDLQQFYAMLDLLAQRIGGARTLATAGSTRDLPLRGVYLFFEPLEVRRESGIGPRVVRVGTHGLGAGSKSTLRQRVEQHRGSTSRGGNHRGSIFRLLVGQALLARGEVPPCNSWGVKGDATKASMALGVDRDTLVKAEAPVEEAVSRYIGAMPFVWLGIDDEPGPQCNRGIIERNSIALLSNYKRRSIDPPSPWWLVADRLYEDRSIIVPGGSSYVHLEGKAQVLLEQAMMNVLDAFEPGKATIMDVVGLVIEDGQLVNLPYDLA